MWFYLAYSSSADPKDPFCSNVLSLQLCLSPLDDSSIPWTSTCPLEKGSFQGHIFHPGLLGLVNKTSNMLKDMTDLLFNNLV